ncbi:MAG: hydantoinase/oxoprolinase family protein, partial [Myxococcales bacterium]|nr:hydantoinase/oxoprolinase family protein [Myxococcales bacterium]
MDTGGTFTDFAWEHEGVLRTLKVSSSPKDPAQAVLEGLNEAGVLAGPIDLVHGSTVGTNTLLEHRGGRVAFLTTRHFEDVLDIGRQSRAQLYNLTPERPESLVPPHMRRGITERMAASGEVIEALTPEEINSACEWLAQLKPDAVAIGLLHSYANDAHERALADAVRERVGCPVSVSRDVLPEMREFERFSTTVANAYLQPVVSRYFDRLGTDIQGRLRVMQSSGGAISFTLAAAEPIRTVLSGPAGGVSGAWEWAKAAGYDKILTFDMGGTSTDVSHYAGTFEREFETQVAGVRMRAPMMSIHTVAAGGGSLLGFDGARFRVGPESAGANPGPASYRRGGPLAVTDANVMVGKIQPAHFPRVFGHAANEPLDGDVVALKFGALAGQTGRRAEDVAHGFIQIAVQQMANAIKKISVARGYDVTRYTLQCFGGAGGQHACLVADALGMQQVLVHPLAGVLSAYGMGLADQNVIREQAVESPLTEAALPAVQAALDALAEAARADLARQQAPGGAVALHRRVHVRY